MVQDDAQVPVVILYKAPGLIHCCDIAVLSGEVNLPHRAGAVAGDKKGYILRLTPGPTFQCKAGVVRKCRVPADEIR